jgi:hypothetical protein
MREALEALAGTSLEQKSAPENERCRYEALCADNAGADALVKAVLEGEGRLLSYSRRRQNLEEVFLARFGDQGKASAGDPEPVAPAGEEASS